MASVEESKAPDWRWWVEKSPFAALAIYTFGFIALSANLAGFRYISTDLLDKNYFAVGLQFAIAAGVSYFGVAYFVRDVVLETKADRQLVLQQRFRFRFAYRLRTLSAILARFCVAVGLLSHLTIATSKTLPFIGAVAVYYQLYLLKRKHELAPELEVWTQCAMFVSCVAAFLYFDLENLWRISFLVLSILFVAFGVAMARDQPSTLAGWEAIISLAIGCAVYGQFVYPIVRHEYGGGEPRSVHIRFIDQARKQSEGYESSIIYGNVVHASESTIYIMVGSDLRFVKREHVISMSASK